jgi:hypothetical protein
MGAKKTMGRGYDQNSKYKKLLFLVVLELDKRFLT